MAATTASAEELAAEKAKLDKERADFAEQHKAFKAQQDALAAQAVTLAAEKMVAVKRGFTEFAEGLIKEGRLLPKDKLGAVEFMSALSADTVIEFGEGAAVTKTPALDWFKGFLKGMPKTVNFSEISAASDKPLNFAEDARAIADAATEYQETQAKRGRMVSDADAVLYVMKQAEK